MRLGGRAANLRLRAHAAAVASGVQATGLKRAAGSRGPSVLAALRAAAAFSAPYASLVTFRLLFYGVVAIDCWLTVATLCDAADRGPPTPSGWLAHARAALLAGGRWLGLEGPEVPLVIAISASIIAFRAALNCTTRLETALLLPAAYAAAHLPRLPALLFPLAAIWFVGAMDWRHVSPAEEKDDKTIVVLTALYLKCSRRERLGIQPCSCPPLKLLYCLLAAADLATLPWAPAPAWPPPLAGLGRLPWPYLRGILAATDLVLLLLVLYAAYAARLRRVASGFIVLIHLLRVSRWPAVYTALLLVPLFPSWAMVPLRLPGVVMFFSAGPGADARDGGGSRSSSACSTPRSPGLSGTHTPAEAPLAPRPHAGGAVEDSPQLPPSDLPLSPIITLGASTAFPADDRLLRPLHLPAGAGPFRKSPPPRPGLLSSVATKSGRWAEALGGLLALLFGAFFVLSLPIAGAQHVAGLATGSLVLCLLQRRGPGYCLTLLTHIVAVLTVLHLHLATPVLHQFHECLGHTLYEEGDFRASLKHYRKSIEIRPEAVPARLQLAAVYNTLRWEEDARIQYEAIVQHLQPHNVEALLGLADYYLLARMERHACTFVSRTAEAAALHNNSTLLSKRLRRLNRVLQCGLDFAPGQQ